MDPITLILAALGAGAAQGLSEGAANAVGEAYAGLRELLKRKVAGVEPAEMALADLPGSNEAQRQALEACLRRLDVGADEAILAASTKVLRLRSSLGGGALIVTGNQVLGVQLGEGNVQTNYFGNS